MTLKRSKYFELTSISASGFQSTTYNSTAFPFPVNAKEYFSNLNIGTKTGGAGNLKVKLQHSIGQDSTAQWFDLLTHSTITASFGQQALFKSESLVSKSLLPYGRYNVICESTHATEGIFNSIVAQAYTDL